MFIAYTRVHVAYPCLSIAFTWQDVSAASIRAITLASVPIPYTGMFIAYTRVSIAYPCLSIAFTPQDVSAASIRAIT